MNSIIYSLSIIGSIVAGATFLPISLNGVEMRYLLHGLSVLALLVLVVGVIYKPTSSTVLLQGSGATFPLPQLMAWIKEFMREYPWVIVSYRGIGSGAGQSEFFSHVTDFCGSDPPLTHEQWVKLHGRVMQVPYLLGAVVVTYNLPGFHGTLNLSGRVLALIYLGRIAYWDDPRIQELNPGYRFPHKPIIVVYRADASGTQYIFTLFLHKAAPDLWPWSLVSKAPKYPVMSSPRARGGKGNPGVAQIIINTPYSIGFVEWGYAIEEHLPVAAIENPYGELVKPSLESIVLAARAAARHLPATPCGDFSRDLYYIVYAKEHGAYPLASWTHLVLWSSYQSRSKSRALALLLKWIAFKGYSVLVPGYAPPPKKVRLLLIEAANQLLRGGVCGG